MSVAASISAVLKRMTRQPQSIPRFRRGLPLAGPFYEHTVAIHQQTKHEKHAAEKLDEHPNEAGERTGKGTEMQRVDILLQSDTKRLFIVDIQADPFGRGRVEIHRVVTLR